MAQGLVLFCHSEFCVESLNLSRNIYIEITILAFLNWTFKLTVGLILSVHRLSASVLTLW